MSVVVIGAGVIGASVAHRLAEAGVRVMVLEAAHPGAGTSGASFAWTNANNKLPRVYHDLNVAGMKAHAALREAFGTAPWWHPGGSLEWEAPERQTALQRRVQRLREWGYAAEWISPAEAQALEPDLDFSVIGDAALAFFPEEGWVDPVPYAAEMLAAAMHHGAALHMGARVVGVETEGGHVTGVAIEDGRHFPAELVVNCAGCRLNDVSGNPAWHIPMAPRRGELVFTFPAPARVRRVIRAPGVDFRPDGAGRLMLSAPDDAEPPDPDALVARVRRLLPRLGDAGPEAVRSAVRPIPADGFSAVGPLPQVEGYYVVVTHSGVTLAPFLGQAVADEVIHGNARPELAAFRPARFFG